MLLSIGIMVKNEEKYLDRCLNSLAPLLENLDSELIIVDTGSTDNTINIAKKYTNKIYFHEWNNDFSKMRNTVLSYCTGEWFLSIDGDEIFENCSDIINFFTTKEYLNFNCATINIKNITEIKNETNFLLFSPYRLFHKDKDFKYIGIIHEQPVIKTPIKYLNANCLHYGYLSDDKILMKIKFDRNTTILKAALKKEPNNVYYLYQLSTSYSMYQDHYEAVNIIKKAYDLIKNGPNKINFIHIYQTLCAEYLNINDYINAEKYALESLKIQNDFIDFYYFLGIAQKELGKVPEAIISFDSYIDLYCSFNNLKKNISFNYYTLSYLDRVYYCLSELYIKMQDYSNAISALIELDENKYKLQVIHKDLITGIVESNNYELLFTYENELLKNNKTKQLNDFYTILSEYKLTLDEKTSSSIELLFSQGTSNYSFLNKVIIEFKKNNSIDLNYYKSFINNIDLSKEENYYGDLIYILLIQNYDMAKLFSKCNFIKITNFLKYISDKYEDCNEIIYDYIKNTEIKDKLIYIRFYKEICHYLIILDKLDNNELEIIYNLYLDYGFKYIHFIYTDYVIDMACIGDVKNEEESFLLLINKAFRYKESNIKLYIKTLKEALQTFNSMKGLIFYLLNQI